MPNKKVIVYVKHYLTPSGITYFQQEWFPWVHSILAQQPGFISICHNIKGLCAGISLQFEDSTTFEAWLAHPSHDSLVDALDDHRDRNYWEAARTDNEQAEPSALQWMEIKPRKNGLNPKEKEFGDVWESTRTRSGKPLQELTLDELRNSTQDFLPYAGNPANVSFEDRKLPTRDGISLSIRIYNCELPPDTPALIFYPGCGFVFDLFDVNSIICSRIAFFSGIKIILVQFRLAPEHPMPTSIYDGYDAAVYIATHAKLFGIDSNQLLLGGWCSGAQCATAVSHLAHRSGLLKIHHQILLGGSYDVTSSIRDFDEYERQDKILSRKFIEYIASRYYGCPLASANFLLSPYHAKDFTGLPPTTLLCGEYDALRNDTEGYFCKLLQAGIPVEKIVLKGQTHNTIAMRSVLTDGLDPAEAMANVIKTQLSLESNR